MKLAVVVALTGLAGCASWTSPFRSEVPHGGLRVRELSVTELGEGVFEASAPPQSTVSPQFVDGDALLVATMGGSIELRDLKSMAPRWKRAINPGVSAPPLVLGSSVVVAGMDARVRRLRLATGQEDWNVKLPAESAGGIAAGQGLLYVTTGDDALVALDEKTGKALWSYKRPARDGNVMWSLKGSAVPLLSSDARSVYAGFSDGVFVALEASSGKTLWERNFDRIGRFRDADVPPVLSADGSTIYVSIVDGDLVALKATDGSTLWSVPGAAATPPFIDVAGKAFYLSTREGRVVKYGLDDRRTLWSYNLGTRGVGSKPIRVGEGYIAVTTTRGGLVLLDSKVGALVSDDTFATGGLAAPVFDGRRLVALSNRNRLHLYSVEPR